MGWSGATPIGTLSIELQAAIGFHRSFTGLPTGRGEELPPAWARSVAHNAPKCRNWLKESHGALIKACDFKNLLARYSIREHL